jgi:hypothetical protein
MTAPTVASPIRVDEVRDQLITVDEARDRVARSEPLGSYEFTVGDPVEFKVDDSWSDEIDALRDNQLVPAFVRLGAKEFQLTKEALFKANALAGFREAVARDFTGELMAENLNHMLTNTKRGKDRKILTTGDVAATITKSTVTPYSNVQLLDNILQGVEQKYGVGEILVDYKMHHSLTRTAMRLIVPEHRRNIRDTGIDDDTWSVGLEINNSLSGSSSTEIIGYLFRWWCTNGATTVHNGKKWSRKRKSSEADMYAWARAQVDEVLGGLEGELDSVQNTVYQDLTGEFNAMAQDVFNKYGIKLAQQRTIYEIMADQGIFTMYHLMQAITQAANDNTLPVRVQDRLLRTGGDLPHNHAERCSLGALHLEDGDFDDDSDED